jgi:hypothetical protein
MTPEIIERVHAWLHRRQAWVLADPYRDGLDHEWWSAVERFRSHERAGARAALGACLTGILLAIVREAWSNPQIGVAFCDGQWSVLRDRGIILEGQNRHDTDALALVAALEDAPPWG